MRRFLTLLPLLLLATAARAMEPAADPQYAAVRIRSHGASATVIATEPGRSWLLGCCHQFFARGEQIDPALVHKPFKFDGPAQPYARQVLAQARVIAYDAKRDLSLMEVDNGPFYYVPVAPRGHRPGRCVTVGYDEMKWPVTCRAATVFKSDRLTQWTHEPPWHGRSGGGLIDVDGRYLIGVVQAYTSPAGRPDKGLHASLESVHEFMAPHWQRCPQFGRPALAQAPPQYPGPTGWLEIDRANRVPNRTGSQCGWSSLETLARHHRIQALYDLTRQYHGLSSPGQVAQVLGARGVRYRQQQPGQRDTGILTGEGRRLGCLVGLGGKHAVTCLGSDGQTVRVIDNEGPRALEVQDWPAAQFLAQWDGWAVVLYPGAQGPAPQFFQSPGQSCPGGT